MKTLASRIVTMAAGAMFLGTLAYGQTEMKAQIPFAFRTAISFLPAGDYTVTRAYGHGGAPITSLWNKASHQRVFAPATVVDIAKTGSAAVIFQCGKERACVLAGVRDANGTVTYNAPKRSAREKEADVARVEIPLRVANGE